MWDSFVPADLYSYVLYPPLFVFCMMSYVLWWSPSHKDWEYKILTNMT